MAKIIILSLVMWNTAVMLLYALDKRRAAGRRRRVRESILLWLAFAGGGWGALAGMLLFRHKTRKLRFRILVPLAALGQLALACIILR